MAKIFYKHKIENLINIIKIITIHHFHFDKNYKFKGEKHDFWEIVYALKSDVICYGEGKKVVLKEGGLIFHKPKEFHSIEADGKTDSEVIVITFECKSEAMRFFFGKNFMLDGRLKMYIYSVLSEAKKTFIMPKFEPSLVKLELQNTPNLGGLQMIRLNLEQLFINIMRDALADTDTEEAFIPKEMLASHIENAVINYLKENIYGKISLNDICDKLYYGKTYLCTQFKKNTGKTIFDYYNNMKIKEAKKLIKKGIALSQITEMLMFDTQAYFSYTFKKYTGITPKQYASENKKCATVLL